MERDNCDKLQQHVSDADTPTSMVEYAVADQVVLAGQPQPEDWAILANRGFGLVINIRSDADRAAKQAANAAAAGLRYIHLTIPAYELERPHLQKFRDALAQAHPDEKVLFHCRTASRTGLVWLLSRIIFDGWSHEAATAELHAAGYDADSMDVFAFCSEDYFERAETAAPA